MKLKGASYKQNTRNFFKKYKADDLIARAERGEKIWNRHLHRYVTLEELKATLATAQSAQAEMEALKAEQAAPQPMPEPERACNMCGNPVSVDQVCARCEEPVCENCMQHGDAMECIEETRCKDCHETILTARANAQ